MLLHMRTTFIIDDDLYVQVKKLAVDQRRTATSVVEEAMRKYIAEHVPTVRQESRIRLPTFSSALVNPDLDLRSNAAVQDYLDDVDPSHEVKRVQDRVYA